MKICWVQICLIIFLLCPSICEAQKDTSFDRIPVSERIYFGGGGSFSTGVHPYYGYRYTYISISPLVGYMITPKFSTGSFVTYQLYNYPDQQVSNSQYGISPFLQYRIKNMFAYAEYSILSVPTFDNSSRKIYTRFPVGLGYSMPLGGKAKINAMALYDLKYNRQTSAFASPWIIRVFFSVGRLSF
jgi:hypothetical protein